MILEASALTAVLSMTAIGVHFITRHGLLHWLSIWLLYARAALVTGRWVARQIPGLWRGAYPQAVVWVKEQG